MIFIKKILIFLSQVYEGEKWIEIQKFKQYLKKRSDPYTRYNVDKVLEVYSWFVLPNYRHRGLSIV